MSYYLQQNWEMEHPVNIQNGLIFTLALCGRGVLFAVQNGEETDYKSRNGIEIECGQKI